MKGTDGNLCLEMPLWSVVASDLHEATNIKLWTLCTCPRRH